MKINMDDKTNFGWFYGTHKRVTRFALKNIPELANYKGLLEEFAQRPDFDEKGLFNNWHFFSPTLKKKNVDFNGKNNAFSKYKEHVENMLKGISEKNSDKYIEHAGRAIHFLQDMTQPQHTQKSFIFNKILHLRMHLAFEEFVKENQQDCFCEYIEKPFINRSYDDIFMENVNLSYKSELPLSNNRYIWERLGKNGINQAISSTKDFLTKLSTLIKSDQLELPFK